jgi:hypothetical protein
VIGRIIGQERGTSVNDAQYRLRLRARVKANLSSGTVEEIYGVFVTLLGSVDPLELLQIYPASLQLTITDYAIPAQDAPVFADFLHDSRAAGIGSFLVYSEFLQALTLSCPVSATLTAAHNFPGYPVTIYVNSTADFPAQGEIFLETSLGAVKRFSYLSKTATTFEQVTAKEGANDSFPIGTALYLYPLPSTSLTGAFSSPFPGTMPVADTSAFPSSGFVLLGYRGTVFSLFSYSGKTGTSFTGVVLVEGTASIHASGNIVVSTNKVLSSDTVPASGGHLSGILAA